MCAFPSNHARRVPNVNEAEGCAVHVVRSGFFWGSDLVNSWTAAFVGSFEFNLAGEGSSEKFHQLP
jgi:hypothetical protein